LTFVGIDLAWKATNRTGLAVVNDAGQLTESSSAHSDAEIEAWLALNATEAVVVAVDAPLIVENPTGQRMAEKLIGQAYGKYGASAYSANTTNPLFNPPRAQVLASRMSWDVDPSTPTGDGTTVCIEVYPHPALVGLFQLPERILYKKGRNRLAGFVQLAAHLESITELNLHESPRWGHLTTTIADPRPGDLNRIEDEIDAIFCAHLAWLWHHNRAALHVYGDVEGGYIVAPPPPTHDARLLVPHIESVTPARLPQ
jgi:predicted RNase H-like nuclease